MVAPKIIDVVGGCRNENENKDCERAQEVDRRKNVSLRHFVTEIACTDRAYDVEEADQPDGPCADIDTQTSIDEVSGQMDRDEEHLKAASEVAEDQQHVTFVSERLAQSLRYGLRGCRRPA